MSHANTDPSATLSRRALLQRYGTPLLCAVALGTGVSVVRAMMPKTPTTAPTETGHTFEDSIAATVTAAANKNYAGNTEGWDPNLVRMMQDAAVHVADLVASDEIKLSSGVLITPPSDIAAAMGPGSHHFILTAMHALAGDEEPYGIAAKDLRLTQTTRKTSVYYQSLDPRQISIFRAVQNGEPLDAIIIAVRANDAQLFNGVSPMAIASTKPDSGDKLLNDGYPREVGYGDFPTLYFAVGDVEYADDTNIQLRVMSDYGGSGGPFVNQHGEIVGILRAGVLDDSLQFSATNVINASWQKLTF